MVYPMRSISHSIRWVVSKLCLLRANTPDRQFSAGYIDIRNSPPRLAKSNSGFPRMLLRQNAIMSPIANMASVCTRPKFMGGEDPSRLSDQAVDLIAERLEDECPLRQIVGPSGDAADGLRNLEAEASRQDKASLCI